jgi:DNA invertase Pin-like site-specific DNA recombinase
MKKIGYARVSTKDQNLEMQIEAMKHAGCDKIYMEKKSERKSGSEFN